MFGNVTGFNRAASLLVLGRYLFWQSMVFNEGLVGWRETEVEQGMAKEIPLL